MARLLRPQMLDDLGLAPTLRWLARTVEERTGVAVALDVSVGDSVDPDAETLVFRLVQESLTNIVKHAGVRHARVAVRTSPESILLTVADEGTGFDAEAVLAGAEEEKGFGVRAMRDRVQSFNGRFQIESSGKGTVLEAEIPLEARS
jgi:two-component system NarL family sensor kinase